MAVKFLDLEWQGLHAQIDISTGPSGRPKIGTVLLIPDAATIAGARDFLAAVHRCDRWFAERPESPAISPAEIVSIFELLDPDAADLAIARPIQEWIAAQHSKLERGVS